MAMSGVSVADECVNVFNEVKLKKKRHRFIIFKITDNLKDIVVDQCGPDDAPWEDFKACLPADDCRYAAYDFHYSLGDAGVRQELIFISWCPETAKVKKKMIYASSKDALKKKLLGVSESEVQATDMSELDRDEIEDKLKSKKVK